MFYTIKGYTPAAFDFGFHDTQTRARITHDGSVQIDDRDSMIAVATADQSYVRDLSQKVEAGTMFGTMLDQNAVYAILLGRIAELEKRST